jgi:hypothetical protein
MLRSVFVTVLGNSLDCLVAGPTPLSRHPLRCGPLA